MVDVEQDKRRNALINRIGQIADLAASKPLQGELGDIAYDLLRQAAAQLSSDRHRLAALTPAPAWRTMDSAPFERFVLVFPHDGEACEAMQYRGSGWMTFGCNGGARISPTHWMPLPSPPGDVE